MRYKNFMRKAVAWAVSAVFCAAAGSAICAAADNGGNTMQAGALTMQWDASGTISSVQLHGEERISSSSSGFLVRDCASNQAYAFEQALKGGSVKTQSGDLGKAGVHLDVTYQKQGSGIRVSGKIRNIKGGDRLIRLEYLLPVTADGMYWYMDTEDRTFIRNNGRYTNAIQNSLPGHKMSLYPLGTVSDGKHAAAIGVPMDPPQASLISYIKEFRRQGLAVSFDFALTSKTPKNPSEAAFSFVLYAPERPDWGFRSALQDYYDLFPQFFVNRSWGGGNWLFQHPYEQLSGVEDFHFRYNETPASYAFDKKCGVASCQYTAPHEQWMEWPGMPKEPEPTYDQYLGRFDELLRDTSGKMEPGFPTVTQKNAAEAMKNSAILLENGKYFTVGWYAYGVSVCFVTNHTPDIPGWNSYKLQIANVKQAEKKALAEGDKLDGVYIDNTAGLGEFNYRQDHFQYADLPLLWDNNNRLVLPAYNSIYSYVKGIRDYCDERDQIVMANMVFPERGIAPYVHMIDAPGSECGPSWGWDPYIQRLRRAMVNQKPWMLLLGHDLGKNSWGASSCPMSIKEDIMKSSVAYGHFANVIGYRVPMKDFENARPLFRKYTPIAVMEDKLGWHPIPDARVMGNAHLGSERFGDLKKGAAIFTVLNTSDERFEGEVEISLKDQGVSAGRAKELVAYDLLENHFVKISKTNDRLSYSLRLKKKDVSCVIVGTKEEIWSMFYDRVKETVQRSQRAMKEIPAELDEILDVVPSQWKDIEKHVKSAASITKSDAKSAMKNIKTLYGDMSAVVPLALEAHDEMLNCQELLRVDVLDIYADVCQILSGFFGLKPAEGVDKVIPPAKDNQGTTPDANPEPGSKDPFDRPQDHDDASASTEDQAEDDHQHGNGKSNDDSTVIAVAASVGAVAVAAAGVAVTAVAMKNKGKKKEAPSKKQKKEEEKPEK